MKRMKNDDVVSNFVGRFGDCQNHGGSLTSENGKLYSYNTVIAQYIAGVGLVVNATKYSSTTSTIQNKVRREAYSFIETDKHVPMNTQDLSSYIPVNA
jgi:hypothetical protein